MEPITICLICFAAVGLWTVFFALRGARSLLIALFEVLLWTIGGLIGYGLLNLVFNFIIILFTDASVLGDMIKESFGGIGVFIFVLAILAGIGYVLFLCGSFVFGIVTMVAGFLWTFIVQWVVILFVAVYDYLETKSNNLYGLMIHKIYDHIAKS